MSNDANIVLGINIIVLLGIVLLILKLSNELTWSWGWITLPFYGGIVVLICVVVCVFNKRN